jgi:hypothetical protein
MSDPPFGSRQPLGPVSRFEKCCVVAACAPPSCRTKKCSFHARRIRTHLIGFTRNSAHQCGHPLAECQPIGRTRLWKRCMVVNIRSVSPTLDIPRHCDLAVGAPSIVARALRPLLTPVPFDQTRLWRLPDIGSSRRGDRSPFQLPAYARI